MKRLFTFFLALMLVFSLAACGPTNDPDDTIGTITTETPDTTIEDTSPDADSIISIPLLDRGGIKIDLKGMFPGDDFGITGPQLKILIDNTTDKNIVVQVRDVSVNGFMTDPSCSIEVAAGKKAVDAITWFVSDLEKSEITQFETVEFRFYIFDANTWDDLINSEIIVLKLN